MKIYESTDAFQKPSRAIVAVGSFDGVHLGHRLLLEQLRGKAREVGGEVVIVTFWPPPKLVLSQNRSVPVQLLTTFDEKVAILTQLNVDHLLKIRFTKTFSQLSAQDFIQQVLTERVGVTQLVVGYDHHFGKDRTGDITLLRESGRYHGFTVTEVLPVMAGNVIVSATKIRQLLLAGVVEEVPAYLGRPYEIDCAVLRHGLDRKQNLNIDLAAINAYKLIPSDGHYSIQVTHQNIVAEGILCIARTKGTPTMVLSIPNASNFTLPIANLRIQFSKHIRSI